MHRVQKWYVFLTIPKPDPLGSWIWQYDICFFAHPNHTTCISIRFYPKFIFPGDFCVPITGHDLLDINIMHLFTPNFTLNSVLLATKTNFPLSNKKYKKKIVWNNEEHISFSEQRNHFFRNDTLTLHEIKVWCSILP